MLRHMYLSITGPRVRGGPVQRGPADAHLTFADVNQLRRGMNLCVAIFAVFLLVAGPIPLSRISTHGVECHFDIIRSILRGVSTWESWLDANTFASLIPVFRRSIGLHAHQPRRSRSLSVGAEAQRGDFLGSLPPFRADEDSLRGAARLDGERSDLIMEYLSYLMERGAEEAEPATPGAFSGMTLIYLSAFC
jgi:hypothetical protein